MKKITSLSLALLVCFLTGCDNGAVAYNDKLVQIEDDCLPVLDEMNVFLETFKGTEAQLAEWQTMHSRIMARLNQSVTEMEAAAPPAGLAMAPQLHKTYVKYIKALRDIHDEPLNNLVLSMADVLGPNPSPGASNALEFARNTYEQQAIKASKPLLNMQKAYARKHGMTLME